MKFRIYLSIIFFIIISFTLSGCFECDAPSSSDDPFDVSLVCPVTYDSVYTNYVTLMWNYYGATGDIWSYIYLDTIDHGSALPDSKLYDSVNNITEYRLAGLETGKTYYWSIQVKAGNGWDRSRMSWFYTNDVFWPALTVYNPTPESAAVDIVTDPELAWQCYNPDIETISYNVFFGTTNPPPLVSTRQSDTAFTPGTLVLDETYYWKVNSYNAADDSLIGPIWFFTTTDVVPFTPYNPSPGDDSIGVDVDLTLSWDIHNPGHEVVYVDLYFDTLSDPVKYIDSTYARTAQMQDLESGLTYYWKIVVFRSPTDSIIGPTWKFTTATPTIGVYARVELESRLMDGIFADDEIRVRFDSSYAPNGPIDTLAADSVKVNGNLMDYSAYSGRYTYVEQPSLRWLDNSETYLFNIYGNSSVPSMGCQTEFLVCSPRITSPANMATVSTDGFAVTWEDYCAGSVRLTLVASGDTTDVSANTTNDGSYTFSAADLLPLVGNPRFYNLVIIFKQEDPLVAAGLDSRSEIVMQSSHSIAVYVQ